VNDAQLEHSGFVTLIGRPNTGKSTLINAIIGRKLAITSNTPQTTRHRFRAVVDSPESQLILVDTPGVHKPHDALGEELNHSALKALEQVDAICVLVDACAAFGRGDKWVMDAVKATKAPRVLVISKCDLVSAEAAEQQLEQAANYLEPQHAITLSALSGQGIQEFVAGVTSMLPPGPRWFPEGTTTDQSLEVIVSEFIREKILRDTFDEVPHAVGVSISELEYNKGKNLYRIFATIFVERDSQKGIIIGRGGEMIKAIGVHSREELEKFLAGKVFLDLRVKVRKGWRRDAAQIRRFGYGEGL
jgi:GTP-binding protein Era